MSDIEMAYIQYAQDVHRYLFSLSNNEDLAEELTQETFFRAMRTIHTYDGSCKLSVWFCQIARHIWYQWLDKHSGQKSVELMDDLPGSGSLEEDMVMHMEKTTLYTAIHHLPEPMREVVHMRLTGEFSFAEIGEILGENENWARVTFYRAKLKLMEEMR